jgi:hypothetical protein
MTFDLSVNSKTLLTFSQFGLFSKSFPRFLQDRPSRRTHPFYATLKRNEVVLSNPGATVYAKHGPIFRKLLLGVDSVGHDIRRFRSVCHFRMGLHERSFWI